MMAESKEKSHYTAGSCMSAGKASINILIKRIDHGSIRGLPMP